MAGGGHGTHAGNPHVLDVVKQCCPVELCSDGDDAYLNCPMWQPLAAEVIKHLEIWPVRLRNWMCNCISFKST